MNGSELEKIFFDNLFDIYEKDEIKAITRLVFEDVFESTIVNLASIRSFALSAEQSEKSIAILNRLKKSEPVQYILGSAWFCGMKLKVSNAVLIPRPETEELVHMIAGELKDAAPSILDIGAGSGCIAVGLKKSLPSAVITGIDNSINALDIARQNASIENKEVDFIQFDILNWKDNMEFSNLPQKFDVIVSNPPYVLNAEKSLLASSVINFEPHEALFVPDNDPLVFYRAIADFAVKHLKEKGSLYFEINNSEADNIIQILAEKGYNSIKALNDLSGNQRFIKAIRN